jgi:hypothetical protein
LDSILCYLLVLLTQCKQDYPIAYYDSFQIEKSLEGETIDWIDAGSGFDMKLYDSILAVVSGNENHYFYFYNYKTHEKLAEIGTKGKGPGEFTGYPKLMSYFTETDNQILCWIRDSDKRQFIQVSLNASVDSGHFVVNKILEIAKTGNAGICELLNDSIIADNSWRRENESLCVYKFGQEDMLWSIKKDKDLEMRSSYGPSSSQILHVSTTNQKIVTSFAYIPRIHIYSSSGILEKVIEEKNSPGIVAPSGGPREFEQKNPFRFYGALLSEKFIIIIDENRILGEITPSKILIFDYNGNAIARYSLDRVIRGYTMDWEQGHMIAFDPGNYEFIKYDLSEALKN